MNPWDHDLSFLNNPRERTQDYQFRFVISKYMSEKEQNKLVHSRSTILGPDGEPVDVSPRPWVLQRDGNALERMRFAMTSVGTFQMEMEPVMDWDYKEYPEDMTW